MTASRIIEAAAAESCHPWPRHLLSSASWSAMAAALAEEPDLGLLALWAETTQVHTLLLSETRATPLMASVPLDAGCFPALSPTRPSAAVFERLIHDLWGHVATAATDTRPWLDHRTWPASTPLSTRPGPPPAEPEIPEMAVPAEDGVSQLPIGPAPGSIDGAWHLRLTLEGETITQAEVRLGYAHRGSLALMCGKSPRVAARFVARLSGESTVAHALAFALASEAALAIAAPPRAAVLRRLMLELERIAVHLNDLARIAAEVSVPAVSAACGEQREHLLRGLDAAFGHRLMMDLVVPGGISGDIGPAALPALRRTLGGLAAALPGVWRRFSSGPCLSRLTGLGRLSYRDTMALALGGVAGRAAGRRFDARSVSAERSFVCPTEPAGDAAARTRLRMTEIDASLSMLGQLLDQLPEGETSVAVPNLSGEGIGCAESARGDVWHWLRLDHGQIAAVFPRDPAWALWPAAERALVGAAIEDAAAIQRSFGLSASAADL